MFVLKPMLKYLILLYFCFLFNKGISQDSGGICDSSIKAPIRAYFEGYSYKYEDGSGFEIFRMERSYFKKEFRLSLSDSSYRIIKFSFTTNLANGDLLEIIGGGEGIKVDRDKYTELLHKITRRSLISVDNIIVSKNGQCYKVPSFVCYMLK
jgi:hypothetical protein